MIHCAVLTTKLTHTLRLLSLALLLITATAQSFASSDLLQKNKVKMAFVFNIAKFVSWPEVDSKLRSEDLMLCFYQHNSLKDSVDLLTGRTAAGRKLQYSVVSHYQDAEACDILYYTAAEQPQLEQEALAYRGQPLALLTIADLTNYAAQTPISNNLQVALVRKDTKIGLDVNLRAVDRANLKISSQLLKLAHLINE